MTRGPRPSSESAGVGGRRILVLALAALALAHAVSLWFVCDDAFITYRYAANLAHGLGPVYNAGERVEGYTDFLWMLLAALVVRAGGPPDQWMPVLGVLSALGVVALVGWAGLRRGAGVYAGVILAASTAFSAWATGGLETAFFTLWTVVGFVSLAHGLEAEHGARWRLASASAFALAGLTRPEGWLVGACAGGYLALRTWRGRVAWRGLAAWWALWLALLLPHLLWRHAFYGHWFPNTFAVKSPGAGRLWEGARYLLEGLHAQHLDLFIPVLAMWAWRRRAAPLGREALGLALSIAIPFYAYVCTTGGDFMPLHRYLVPMLPIVAILAGAALADALGGRRRVVAAAIAALTLASYAGWNLYDTWDHQRPWVRGRLGSVQITREDTRDWRAAGEALARLAAPGDTLATSAAGVIPYVTGLHTIDMLGLTAPDLSRYRVRGGTLPGHALRLEGQWIQHAPPHFLLAHPLEQRPDSPLSLSLDIEDEWRGPVLEHYDLIGIPVPGPPRSVIVCGMRRDLASRLPP